VFVALMVCTGCENIGSGLLNLINRQSEHKGLLVATIGGKKIYMDEYQRIYENLIKHSRDVYPGKSDAELEKSLKLKDLTLEFIIANELLLLTAERQGITVTKDELKELITNEPTFMKDGVFNMDAYLRTLKLNRMTPEDFEAELKDELIIQKVRNFLTEDVKLNNKELEILKEAKESEKLRNIYLDRKKEIVVKEHIEKLKNEVNIFINYEVLP